MSDELTPKPQVKWPRLLWGIIVRPRTTFLYLREEGRRAWWPTALLVILLAVLPIIVGAPIATQQAREAVKAVQVQIVTPPEPGVSVEVEQQQLSPEQQRQMEQAMRVASSPLIIVVFPTIGRIAGVISGWLVWAGALYLAGMVIGGHSRFGDLLRMIIWAWIPYALRALFQTLYILLAGRLITNPGLSGLVADNRPVGEIIASPPSLGQMLASAFLARVDLFLFWNLALLIIGTMVVSRISGRKAIGLVLGTWAVLTALSLIPTLVGGVVASSSIGLR